MTRLEKLRAAMSEKCLDAVLVLNHLNQYYISEFDFSDGFLLITKSKAYLVTDFRYYEMATKAVSSDFEILTPKDRDGFLKEVFSGEGIKTVGFEGGYLSYESYMHYAETHSDRKFINIGNMIELIRQIKSDDEISFMQRAQDIADKAFSHIVNILNPNMTELEVAVELEYAMRREGAEDFSFSTIAVSGDASSLPHGTPRDVKLKQGFLTMDFGAKYKGYCSDMTRTVVIGKADDEMKKLYNTVLSAQCAAIDFLRAGVDAGEADKVARDIIDAHPEFKGAFGHSLGHSVGLFVHETPTLSPRSFGRVLRAGEILTVEPGIYLFGKYGCRIEDMVKIEEGGVYNFTHSAKELIEI